MGLEQSQMKLPFDTYKAQGKWDSHTKPPPLKFNSQKLQNMQGNEPSPQESTSKYSQQENV